MKFLGGIPVKTKGSNVFLKGLALMLIAVTAIPAFSVLTVSAKKTSFTNKKGSVSVVCGSYKKKFTAKKYKKNFTKALKAALETARKKANNKKKAVVTVSKGKHMLTETLFIYSNTTLKATGSTFRCTKGNHLKNGFDGKKSSAKAYNGARNITVIGGTWDADVAFKNASKTAGANGSDNSKYTNSSLRFAHCKNITVKKAKFKNNYNSHDIELGGVDGAKISGCSFANDKSMNSLNISGGVEAVQVDVTIQKAMEHFASYDKTPCQNIEIFKNTFTNKYRAAGTHHSVVGKPYKNISVHDNTITNSAGIAVNAVHWIDSKIYNNNMINVGSGIDYYSVASHNMYNLNKLSFSGVDKLFRDSKCYIYGNKIKVRKEKNLLSYKFGIRAAGTDVTKASSTTAPKGKYFIYGVNIGADKSGKNIANTVNGSFEAGIAAVFSKNAVISGNKIDLSNCAYKTSNALYVSDSVNAAVKNNTVSDNKKAASYTKNGMSLRNSENVLITGNKISSQNFGIQILYGILNTNITGNTISSKTSNCVYLSGKEDKTPSVTKTLSVTNNKFDCIGYDRDDSAVNLIFSKLDVSAHSNTEPDKTNTSYYIKGGSDRARCIIGDMETEGLTADPTEDGVLISWEDVYADGYRVSRYVNGKADFAIEIDKTEYFDNYELTGDEVYYTVEPYIISEGIILYSIPMKVTI